MHGIIVCNDPKQGNPNPNYLYIMTPMFGKPGRPPEDIWIRRREIYSAVSPLILNLGAKRLMMRQAAKAASLSIGGLYYYFPNKNDLILHGLHPEALRRRCLEFVDHAGVWRDQNIHKYFEEYLDFAIANVEFIRPSVYAALELGRDEFLSSVDLSVNMSAKDFRELKRLILPGASDEDLDHIERSLHRIMISASLDKNLSSDEVRKDMAAIFQGHLIALPLPYTELTTTLFEKQTTE